MSNDPTESHIPQPNGNSPSDAAAAEEAMIERARIALESSPETIGPYRIIEKLGQGGMGEVYRAEQRVPIRRQVAIKLIKLGMDTKQVIARFEAERQALALMDHPHIAKVLDASTDDSGRPYFVMEYVKGVPIHEYADKNQLTIQERLGLFGQVCHAIQHAHHKGVIHRDIKPSNVLTYTQDGKPHAKIIDFGIAKAIAQQLTDQTFYTLHTQFLGTPQYMSPEQAEGNLDIDTRTDVYSLGVMLYELLTGTTPFSIAELRAGAVDQMRKIICETEPPKPSTRLTIETATLNAIAAARRVEPTRLGALVRGELDWIVMMALDKDRRRRYDTPNDLADDIEAFLQGERVQAAPPSRVYRMQKFVRKNKGAVAIASILGTSLGVGLAGTSWQWFRADRNAKVAELSSAEAKVARQRAEDALKQAEKEREIAIEQRDNAEFEAYVANLNFANGAVERGEYREAQEYLKRCPEQHRGWEWRFLNEMTDGVATVSIGENDEITVDPTGCVLVKQTGNSDTLHYSSELDKQVTLSLPGNLPASIGSIAVSGDGNVVYGVTKNDDDPSISQLIIRIESNGECETLAELSPLGVEEIAAVSHDGKYFVARLNDGGLRLVSAESDLPDSIKLPEATGICVIGFIPMDGGTVEQLLISVENQARLYRLPSDGNGFQTLKHLESIVFKKRYHDRLSVVHLGGYHTFNSDILSLLGENNAEMITTSEDRKFCVFQRDANTAEIWSILSQSQLKSIRRTEKMEFSSDGQSLWSIASDGQVIVYEMRGHAEGDIVDSPGASEVGMVTEPQYLTSTLLLQDNGEILARNGRIVGHDFHRNNNRDILVVGSKFVETVRDYVEDRTGHIVRIDDINMLPRHSQKNDLDSRANDTLSLVSHATRTLDINETNGVSRRFDMFPHGLRVSDTRRSRVLTYIRIDWPSNVRSICLSADKKSIFLLSSDNSWVCYDTSSRMERNSWNERVFQERAQGQRLVNELWESNVPYESLRSEILADRPPEMKEAAMHILEMRMSFLVRQSTKLFETNRYQFVGRKQDMLTEIASQCSDSRMYRAGGPMIGLIESWSGEPESEDVSRFRNALLQNELEPNLREHLAVVTQGYLAADPLSKGRQLIAALGFLRLGDFKASKDLLQPLLDNRAFSEVAYYVPISLCCVSILAMHAGDVGDAVKMFDEAEIARTSAIANKKWYEPGQMFFEETRAKLEAFRESSKEEK